MTITPSVTGSPFRNRHFTVLWFAMLAFELSNFLMLQLPGFLTSIGLTEGFIGVMYSTAGAAALIARPWLGRVVDLTSRKTVLLIGGAVNVALLAMFAIPESLTPLLWMVFVGWRIAQIALFAVMLTAASDVLRPERRTQGLALFGVSGLITLAFGGLIGDAVTSVVGFRGLFLVSAGLSATSVMIKTRIPSDAFGGGPAKGRRSFWHALAQRDLLPLWLLALTFAIGLQALFTFLRTYVDSEQIGSFGLYFLVYGSAAALLRLVASGTMDRFDPRRLLFAATSGYAVGIGLLALGSSEVEFLISAFLAGTAHGMLFPVLSSQVAQRSRDSERGSAFVAFTALFDLGLVAMAPVIGRIIDASGYTAGFGTVAISVAIGAVAYMIWDRHATAGPVVQGSVRAEYVSFR